MRRLHVTMNPSLRLASLLSALAAVALSSASFADTSPTDDATLPPIDRTFRLFPYESPSLAPYLSYVNIYSTNSLRAGGRIASDPVSDGAQWVKDQFAQIGIRYNLKQAFALATMTDVEQGDSTLGAYLAELEGNWHLTDDGEHATWLTYQINAGSGLGSDANVQTPAANIGSQTEPGAAWTGYNVSVKQVAGGFSAFKGELVVVAGLLNVGNFVDQNRYSNSRFGQLMNSAFIASQTLSEPGEDLGANVQWQPASWIYGIVSVSTNNARAGSVPWLDVNSEDMSYVGELGLISENTLGLGKGVYRFQPMYATSRGDSGGGFSFNFEQALGTAERLGLFGRFGVADEEIAHLGGASAQASLGLISNDPNAWRGTIGDHDYFGVAASWQQSPDGDIDEWAFEATYVLRLTPTASLQPDVQWVFDDGDSTDSVVFQLSLILQW